MKYWNRETYTVNSYYKDLMDIRVNKTFNFEGINYKCNEIGFRGDSIHDEGYKILTVGCSHTQGQGVHDNESWPFYLSRMMGCLQYNCSIGGSSNDTIARNILIFTEIVKPDLVLVMYADAVRKEYYVDGELYPVSSNPWGFFTSSKEGKEMYENIILGQSDDNDQINWHKNHLLITYYLKNLKIPYIWNSGYVDTDLNEDNRFIYDYRKFLGYCFDGLHANAEHNKAFAENFYQYLKGKKEYIKYELH